MQCTAHLRSGGSSTVVRSAEHSHHYGYTATASMYLKQDDGIAVCTVVHATVNSSAHAAVLVRSTTTTAALMYIRYNYYIHFWGHSPFDTQSMYVVVGTLLDTGR